MNENRVNLRDNGKIYFNRALDKYRSFLIPEVVIELDDNGNPKDYCAENKNANKDYQTALHQEYIINELFDTELNVNEKMLFWSPGSGKTLPMVKFLNRQYKLNTEITIFLLIKAQHREDPWIKTFKRSLDKVILDDVLKERNQIVHIINYDSPVFHSKFSDAAKRSNPNNNWIFLIDEYHNFISNVYSNEKKKKGSQNASNVYHSILNRKKQKNDTKILIISGTPIKNDPYELIYAFNLLRPNIFNITEAEFYQEFVEMGQFPRLNPLRKNTFQRRIIGLVSYYYGNTPQYFAKKIKLNFNVVMSKYQFKVYKHFEDIENKYEKKLESSNKKKRNNTAFNTYTKQASLGVIPDLGVINGQTRPRISDVKLNTKLLNEIASGKSKYIDKIKDEKKKIELQNIAQKYKSALKKIYDVVEQYFIKIKEQSPPIKNDLEDYKNKRSVHQLDFFKYFSDPENYNKLSFLTIYLYENSPKFVASIFNAYALGGKQSFYTNYVIGEGIENLKIYMRMFDYYSINESDTIKKSNINYNGFYCEYHGNIEKKDRIKQKDMFNSSNNIRGNQCQFILMSSVGKEAIELTNIIASHELDPSFDDNVSVQYGARGWRRCSHAELPVEERIFYHIKYFCIKSAKLDESMKDSIINSLPEDIEKNEKRSTDLYIEDVAERKRNFKNSFLLAMKESATDCALFKNHNMYGDSGQYTCFNFSRDSILSKTPGPAYKEDLVVDKQSDSGMGSKDTKVERIKVFEITGVILLNDGSFSVPEKYLLDYKSGIVYGHKVNYIVGKCKMNSDGKFAKQNDDIFIITVPSK